MTANLTSIEIHFPTVSDVSTVIIDTVQQTGILPAVIAVGVGVGIIGLIGIAIWSKVMSWDLKRAEKPGVEQ